MTKIIWGVLIAALLSLFLMPYAQSTSTSGDLLGIGASAPPPAFVPVVMPVTVTPPVAIPEKQSEAALAPVAPEAFKPMIAIVIDDVGVDVKRSARAVKNLGAPVTMSYLPYSQHIQQQVDEAVAAGHEIILHLPWEADNEKADPGPHHLAVKMTAAEIQENLLANLDAFKGYIGVNNHMGSKFSRDRAGLEVVMDELKKRGLFYLDSKTTPDSIAEKVAAEKGISTTHRDVFLDHDENSQMVNTSLTEVEEHARRRGTVIAIGHPKDVTLAALESWLPTLEKKGFRLVPLSTVLKYRQENKDAAGK